MGIQSSSIALIIIAYVIIHKPTLHFIQYLGALLHVLYVHDTNCMITCFIGNVGEKTWQIMVIRQIRQSFFPAKVFYCMVYTYNSTYYSSFKLLYLFTLLKVALNSSCVASCKV